MNLLFLELYGSVEKKRKKLEMEGGFREDSLEREIKGSKKKFKKLLLG
jgi:hypothetical protein